MNMFSKLAAAAAALSLLAPASMTLAAPKSPQTKTFKSAKSIGAAKKKAQSSLPVGTELACAIGYYVDDPTVVTVSVSPLGDPIRQGTSILILPLDANGSAVAQLLVTAPTDMVASPGQMYEIQRADPAWQDCVARIG
jgi:hypothetical protein